MCFLHQPYLHSFDADSVLLGKNVYYLRICSKGNGLLCLHQNKNIQTFIHRRRQVVLPPTSNHWIPVLHDLVFPIFPEDSRTTEVYELLFHGSN